MQSKGQAWAEYIIILAVAIIMAGIAMYLAGGFLGTNKGIDEKDSAAYWLSADVAIVRYYLNSSQSQLVIKNNRNFKIEVTNITSGGRGTLVAPGGADSVILNPGQNMQVNVTDLGCSSKSYVLQLVITYSDVNYHTVYSFTGEKPLVGPCMGIYSLPATPECTEDPGCGANSTSCSNYCNGNTAYAYLANPAACQRTCVAGKCKDCSPSCTYSTTDCNKTSYCSSGLCVSCSAGYRNCNENPADACEVNLQTDASNCGSCGNACGTNSTCHTGSSCGANCWSYCNGNNTCNDTFISSCNIPCSGGACSSCAACTTACASCPGGCNPATGQCQAVTYYQSSSNLCGYYSGASSSCGAANNFCAAGTYYPNQSCSASPSNFACVAVSSSASCAVCGNCSGTSDTCNAAVCGTSNSYGCSNICDGQGTGASHCAAPSSTEGATCYCNSMCAGGLVCNTTTNKCSRYYQSGTNLCGYYNGTSASCGAVTTTCPAGQKVSTSQPTCTLGVQLSCVSGYCAVCGDCAGGSDNCSAKSCGTTGYGCTGASVCTGQGTGVGNCVAPGGTGATCYCNAMCTSGVCTGNLCQSVAACNNGLCEVGENYTTCPQDCCNTDCTAKTSPSGGSDGICHPVECTSCTYKTLTSCEGLRAGVDTACTSSSKYGTCCGGTNLHTCSGTNRYCCNGPPASCGPTSGCPR